MSDKRDENSIRTASDPKDGLCGLKSGHLREGTELPRTRFAFAYNAGGIGDFICWTTAIQYAIETHPHLYGHILTPPHFEDLARLWLSSYSPRFSVIVTRSQDFSEIAETPAAIPGKGQYANACGFSLFDLGFVYYNQITPSRIPKEWRRLPPLRGDERPLTRFNLPRSYAVITPAATADNKRLKAEAINEVIYHLEEKGITPVLLGKKDVAPDHKGVSPEGIDPSAVIDLREKTTLSEAGCIMARSRLTLGLDNGLLHLAACSRTTVIWAFTTATPSLIVPPRPPGAKTLILTPPESLKCRFCQNNMKFIIGHDFKRCLYGDNLCTEAFSGEVLISSVEKVLSEE